MRTLTLRSPAKLNLYLKVLNQRKDGYHNIRTLFERINIFDTLNFSPNKQKKIRIFCDHPQVPTGRKNIVYKVAELLRDEFALENGVDITIKKNIPVAAGLAGGSSNGATALLGLNKLWKLSLSQNELIRYGKKIGADIPFFLHDWTWGLGEERGDRVRQVKIDAKLWHILVVPRIKIYTREVYEGMDQAKKAPNRPRMNMLTKQGDNVNILIRNLRKNDLSEAGNFLLNDLEISTFRLCPKILKLKNIIRSYNIRGAALSGSGPSVFGIVDSKKEAVRIGSILKKRYSQVFVVKTF